MSFHFRNVGKKPSVLEIAKPSSSEPWFNNKGELNAGSKQEAAEIIAKLMVEIASGNVSMHNEQDEQIVRSRREVIEEVTAAFNDTKSDDWEKIGAAIAGEINLSLSREGLMRSMLAKMDLDQGEQRPTIRVRRKGVIAFLSTDKGSIGMQFVQQNYVNPDEVNIHANPRLTLLDIARGSANLLEEIFLDSQEAILVTEDVMYLRAVRSAVGIANDQVLLGSGLTPNGLAALRTMVTRWNLNASQLVIGTDVYTDLVNAANGFSNGAFDPVTQHELMRTGMVGYLLGMPVRMDGFRTENQRVLLPGEVLVVSDPENHGGYTDRGPVMAVPVDGFADGGPWRGWYVHEIVSMALTNPRSFGYGLR